MDILLDHRFFVNERPFLVLGANGQVGKALAQRLGSRVLTLSRREADLATPEGLPAILDAIQPCAVMNAAAYTQVDRAEEEESLARIINGDAPGILARWCTKHMVPFIHYSTDYVYSGAGIVPWCEDAPVAPINAYGRTKLAGDLAVIDAGGQWLIFRTSWVYDAHGKNFLNTIIRLAKEHETLRIIADQYGAPTYAQDLADATVTVLEKAFTTPKFPSGIYHLCNSGETTWHEFATTILDRVRQHGVELKVTTIEAISSANYPTPARRPFNSRLDLKKIRETFDVEPPNWRAGLERCLKFLNK